ncbi:18338_t:CDS:1, partial [Racocetra persica]
VDIADQQRLYFLFQLRTCRNWFPLFFWLRDTSIVNAHIIYTNSNSNNTQNSLNSDEFCTYLVWELIQASVSQVPSTRNSQYSITNPP